MMTDSPVKGPRDADAKAAYVWGVPDTDLRLSEKQGLSALFSEKSDAVIRRYFSAPNPVHWVGTLKTLLKPQGDDSIDSDDSADEHAGPSKKARTGVANLSREEIAAFINQKLPSPSSYSKPTAGGWADSKFKPLPARMNFHRHHTLQDQPTTPVALLDPILAQVAEDCEVAVPTAEDCNFTLQVASAMSEHFTKDGDRRDKFRSLLERKYGVKFESIEFGDAKTAGSLTHPKGGLMVNIEVKNEVGTGGELYMSRMQHMRQSMLLGKRRI